MSQNTIQTLIERVRAEFQKVPDVPFSVEQLQSLCGDDHKNVEMVLEFLVDTQFLSRTSTYARLTRIDPSRAAVTAPA